MSKSRVILCILDGWGIAPPSVGNAIAQANPEIYQYLINNFPNNKLEASGEAVGLPKGQDGNSETGHLNIGAGRVVFQDLALINRAIDDGSFFIKPALLDTVKHLNSFQSRVHLLGLITDSGVHASNDHLYALLSFFKKNNISNVYIHLITDGRDSPPQNAIEKVFEVEEKIKEIGVGKIVSVMGRYYAMDRDLRLDRTQKAYDCLTEHSQSTYPQAASYLEKSYQDGVYDEFVIPTSVGSDPESRINSGDAVVFWNFRTDRARQLTKMFLDSSIPNLRFVTMTQYKKDFINPVIFETTHVQNTLGEVISRQNLTQLRAAETEKIAMVSYYFNGQNEISFRGEEHLFIDSPKIATYDLQPEMSTPKLVEEFSNEFKVGSYSLGVINIACPDMVAHTGKIPETIQAIKASDKALEKLMVLSKDTDSYLVITADHGNAEELLNLKTGQIDTEHSNLPVPIILYHPSHPQISLREGKLGDVAPTILELMEIPKPESMTGTSLIES